MTITKEYIDLVKQNNYYEDYQKTIEKMANSKAIYKGKPIPFLYQPLFFTKDDLTLFENTVHLLMSITNKVVKEYLENSNFRKKFGFSKKLEELILVDQGYPINVPIGRFDIFYGYSDEFKFCELNTDGSSAMNEDNTLAKFMLESLPIKELSKKYDIHSFELFDSWVNECMEIYKQFDKKVEKPNVAIVDFKESATSYEFDEFKQSFIKKGYQTIICDPRDLRYMNGKLFYQDFEINIIYRRIVTKELMEHYDEIPDLINAYKDKAVCMIGSLKSQIIHNKIIFKILHDDDTLSFLTKEEQAFVKKHIPLTKEFSNDKDIYQEVLKNKDSYILKPKDDYGSKGVHAGLDYDDSKWQEIVDDAYQNDYLVQEYCKPYLNDFVVYSDKEVHVEQFKSITGMFVYNEKLAGFYTRIGKEHIISGLHSYYTICNLSVTNK